MPGDWRDKARDRVKRKQQGTRFKLVPGDNSFRVLPNHAGLDHPPYYEYRIHRDVGPDKKMVRCGKSIEGEGDCWLCDEIVPRLEKSGKRSKIAQARVLAPGEQFVVQVASADAESGKMIGPLTWYVPTGGAKSMSVQLLGLLASPRRRYDDPKKGYNINVSRTGTGPTDTRYGAIEPDDEPSKVPSSIMSELKPFDKVIPAYDEDEQRAAFYGRSVDEMRSFGRDDDEETGDRKMPKADKKKVSKKEAEEELKRKKKGKKNVSVDEDDDEDEDEDEEDEEEEAPKSKKSKKAAPAKKSKKDEDEDEDDEDEDDEDEDDDEDDEDSDDDEDEDEDDDEDSDDDEDEDEDDDEDDDDEDEDEDDDDEDEDDEPPVKKGKKAAPPKKGKKPEPPPKKSKKSVPPPKKSKKPEPPAKKKSKK